MSATDFGRRFESLLGRERVDAVLRAMTDGRVFLLAGDPGVGKSTIARELARRLGGSATGTGNCVRAEAAARGLSLEAFNALLKADPHEDVAIDAQMATLIARGDSAVFESRLAGHLGRWLAGLGRGGVCSFYLRCEPIMQALRLVERADGHATRAAIEPLLWAHATAHSLDACGEILRGRPGVASVAAETIEREVRRRGADRARMRALYGVELEDPSAHDLIVDTTGPSIEAGAKYILAISTGGSTVSDAALVTGRGAP